MPYLAVLKNPLKIPGSGSAGGSRMTSKCRPNRLFLVPGYICGKNCTKIRSHVKKLLTDRQTDTHTHTHKRWTLHNILGRSSGVTRGRTAPGDTLQRGDTPTKKILWANLQRIVDKRGRTGKKGAGWHPAGGDDTRVKSIKVTVISKKEKRSSVFSGKIWG